MSLFVQKAREPLGQSKKVEGGKLKYPELCATFGMEPKTGSAKIKQLRDIQTKCELRILKNPTRYEIVKMYPPELAETLQQFLSTNKFQKEFDAAIYHTLMKQAGKIIYLSNTELLFLFHEVNDKFKISFSERALKKLGYDESYADVTSIVYSILLLWTKRKINTMIERKIIGTIPGFRVKKGVFDGKGNFKYWEKHNVPIGSELESICKICWLKTSDAFLKNKNKGAWIPPSTWQRFRKYLDDLFRKEQKEYFSMQPVTIYFLPKEKVFQTALEILYNKAPELGIINSEACNKILTSTQLDMLTGDERKFYVEEFIRR